MKKMQKKLWKPKSKVWFIKNDDSKLGRVNEREARGYSTYNVAGL